MIRTSRESRYESAHGLRAAEAKRQAEEAERRRREEEERQRREAEERAKKEAEEAAAATAAEGEGGAPAATGQEASS